MTHAAISGCANCERLSHQEMFLLRREWCATISVGSVVCRARTVPLAFTLPFNSTTGTQNLNPALEERNGRGAQWVLDAAAARVCRHLPRPKPQTPKRDFLCSMEAQRCDGKGAGLGIR